MKPEIEAYLRQHGADYTTEALRRGLLDAGHDPVEVDTALEEWRAMAVDPAITASQRRQFWWWALGLHVAVLVVIGALSLAIGSFAAGAYGLLIILAVVLLIGLGISGLIGRGLLRTSGLTTALVVPVISALLIGGSCLAIGGSSLLAEPPPPPRTGVMELQIEPPLGLDWSGAATCQPHGGTLGFSVFAEDLERSDVGLSVAIDVYAPSGDQGAPEPAPGLETPSVFISLLPQSGTDPPATYTSIFSSRLELDASPDGATGTLQFDGLAREPGEQPPGEATDLETISGTINWSCE